MYIGNEVLYTLYLSNNKHVCKKPDDMPTVMVNNSVHSICFHVLKAGFRQISVYSICSPFHKNSDDKKLS